MKNTKDPIINTTKRVLDEQSNMLNNDTLQRLRDARNNALAQEKQSWIKNKLSLTWITGAGAGLVIASVVSFMIVPQLSTNKLSPLEDLELLTADTDMDLYTQLDFYQWLDESLDGSFLDEPLDES